MDIGHGSVTVGTRRCTSRRASTRSSRCCVTHAGRLVTHGRLLRAVWGTAYSDEAHYVHVYVSQIRRKLEAADPTGSLHGLIVAEPGVGYRIAAD